MSIDKPPVNIKVVGIGALGVSALGSISRYWRIPGVEYLAVDMHTADHPWYPCPGVPTLEISPTSRGIACTEKTVREAATALSFTSALRAAFEGADMVVIATAMGDRTGTGASPVVARIAKESGALVLAFVTSPACFEDKEWRRAAADCAGRLRPEVDQTISVPRSRLQYLNRYHRVCFGPPFPHESAMIAQGILSVVAPFSTPGLVNPQLADVEKVMRVPGEGVVSVGEGQGSHPVLCAADEALDNAAQSVDLSKARGWLAKFSAGPDTSFHDWSEALRFIADKIDHNTNSAVAVSNPEEALRGKAVVTLIATGLQPKGVSWR